MQTRTVSWVIILLLAASCSPASATPVTTATMTERPVPDGRCGDGRCDGPEDSVNCPVDCSAPATIPPVVETPDVLITVGAPSNGAIRPLLGVNAGPVPVQETTNPDLADAYRQIGVTMVRTHDFYGPLDMAVMYPDRTRDPADPRSYDLAESDAVFAAILAAGLEPYLRLGDSWNNVNPPDNPMERANWVQAAVHVVRHYKEGEWAGFDSGLRYVEIWNEPDFSQFWPEPHTRIEFFQLFAETARALKAVFPDLQIGGPGLAPAGFRTPSGQQYAEGFMDYVQDQGVPFDFFSWHMYSNEPADFVDAAAFYRALLDERGYTAAENHITEWNTAIVDSTPLAEQRALRAGLQGAALMTAAWIGLQEQNVDVSTFYRGPDASMEMPTWYGMFYADGRPKPTALAFSLWAKMATHPEALHLQIGTGAGESGLWALAGRDTEGEIALLVANTSGEPVTWGLAFADGRSLTGHTVMVQEIVEAGDSLRSFAPGELPVEMSGYAVQWVTITP